MYQIAVMGHGVVGSGVVEVFYKNRESIQKKAGAEMDIKRILDLQEFPGCPYEDKFTKDFQEILNDPEITVVVETMGGLNPAYHYVKSCLLSGKSVTTSNKELVAAKGAELLKIARENNVNFLFEASVGGGIPIIRPISQCLAANDIETIEGILNGTTNFILTKMIREQMNFEDALALAQKLGYAEKDPTADVEGHDACRKICILASLAFGRHVYPEQVQTEGISGITLADVEYAENWGGVVKLIARAQKLENGKVLAWAGPAFVSRESQLSTVDDVFNAVLVRGDATGDVVFYGKGAGKLPTASAVVADVIDCVKHVQARKYLYWEDGSPDDVADPMAAEAELYVRAVSGQPHRALEEIKKAFSCVRMLSRSGAPRDELAFVTGRDQEGRLRGRLHEMSGWLEPQSVIRVLEDQ